jgi:hypothetical protein
VTTVVRIIGEWNAAKQGLALQVKGAIELFLGCGLVRIETACNAKREFLLNHVRIRGEAYLSEIGLHGTSRDAALRELTPEFSLRQPPEVTIDMSRDLSTLAPGCPMETVRETIFVCVSRADDPRFGNIGLNVRTCTFHEMLHVCGERVRSVDGHLRTNMAGALVVEQLVTTR